MTTKIDWSLPINPSKHFRNTWMRKWDWDIHDLRIALQESYKMEKVSENKYEAYTHARSQGKSRKIIFVIYQDGIFIITGSEGK